MSGQRGASNWVTFAVDSEIAQVELLKAKRVHAFAPKECLISVHGMSKSANGF